MVGMKESTDMKLDTQNTFSPRLIQKLPEEQYPFVMHI